MFHKSHTLLIEQLEEFPEGEHDDAPDSLHGAYKLSKLEKSKNKKKKPIINRLHSYIEL